MTRELWRQARLERCPLHPPVPAIASAANVDLGGGEAISTLARAVRTRDMLLVLDNCEHLIADVARIVAGALGSAPQLRVLATSQEALKVPGEHSYRLDALAVPPTEAPLEVARGYGALQLLEQRAQAADRRFALSDQTVAGAIDLCCRLDGIALAIVMAAARLPMLGIDEVRRRLDERFKFLRHPSRTTPARQQTLFATLEWSHSLLTDAERAILRRLSVFVGSPRLDVAQPVIAAGEVDEWTALDALGTLANKSLVQAELADPPRCRLLETVRMYASEQLGKHDELPSALQRHGQAMARLADEADKEYWVTADAQWSARYAPDIDDFEAAFWRACEREDANAATAADLMLTRLGGGSSRARRSTPHQRAEAAHALLRLHFPGRGPWSGTRWPGAGLTCPAGFPEVSQRARQYVRGKSSAIGLKSTWLSGGWPSSPRRPTIGNRP